MKNNWILKKEDREFRPDSLKTLRSWIRERRVFGSDMVSNDGGETWTPAERVSVLIPFFPSDLAKVTEIPRGYVTKLERKRRSFEMMDMIPMFDIVFLLLLFFAITSSFDVQSGIKVKLPTAVSSTKEVQRNHTIFITRDNLVFLNDKEISLQNLPKKLSGILTKDKEFVVVIKADESVSYGLVIKVMGIAKKAGAKKLIVGVRKMER
jgi:biopolymer transport protein ExbD